MKSMSHGGSFSFSCSESDVNFSSLSHFTDDDDDDDESYIEIALDHHHHDHSKPSNQDDDEDEDEDRDHGGLDHADYLRISFSSSLLPELSASTLPPNHVSDEPASDHPINHIPWSPTVSYSCPLSSSSMEGSCRGPLGSDESSRLHRSTSTKGRLPRVKRLVKTLLFGPRSSSESPTPADDADLARNRRASNIRTSKNGGIMKLLFKFRAMKLGALVASFVKPLQVACDDDDPHQSQNINRRRKNNKSKESSRSTRQWLVQKKQGKISRTTNSSEAVGGGDKSSVLLEIKLSAVRGVLEAIGNSMSTGGTGRKERRTRSCPSSVKSSPIHQGFTSDKQNNKASLYTRETSIQAAIAHCKTSYEHHPYPD